MMTAHWISLGAPRSDEAFESESTEDEFEMMFEPDDDADVDPPAESHRHDHEDLLTVPEPIERGFEQPAGLRPARDSETPSALPFFPEDDNASNRGPADRERDEFSLPDDTDTPDSWDDDLPSRDERPIRGERPDRGFGDEPAHNEFRDDRDDRSLDFDRDDTDEQDFAPLPRDDFRDSDVKDRGFDDRLEFGRDDEFEDARDFPNDRLDRTEPAPRDELRRDARPDRSRRTPEPVSDFGDDRRSTDDNSDFDDLRPQPVPSRGRSDFDDDRTSSETSGVMRPHLSVRKEAPPRASVGQPLTYTVIVTNEGQSPARDVIVEDELPQAKDADLVDTQPAADFDRRTGKLVWTFDELAAGDTREMQVKIVPRGRGVINGVATVRFKTEVSTTTIIESPRLSLTLKSPSELRIGDKVEFAYLIRNDGDGRAEDVVLRSVLPVGLRHPVGDDLEYEIDSLMPGDEREVVLTVVAAESGIHKTTAEVTAAGGVRDDAETRVNIVGQQLSILRRGPKRRYVGRPAVYENIISNDTAFEAIDVRVVEQIPDGMEYVSASSGGNYNPRDGRVTWEIDHIDADDTKTLTVELIARRAGQQQSTVTVIENAGFKTGAEHTTAVEDLHNMNARISQLDRAVATGEHFDIDITLENRGTAEATNVQLVVDVPRGIVPKQAGSRDVEVRPEPGPDGTVIVRYEPIRTIAPGAERTFRIRFAAEGSVTNGLIRARLQYSEMRRELITSESVTAYDSQ